MKNETMIITAGNLPASDQPTGRGCGLIFHSSKARSIRHPKGNSVGSPALAICWLVLWVSLVAGPARAAVHYQVLFDMNDVTNAGGLHGNSLLVASDGSLYGTTEG